MRGRRPGPTATRNRVIRQVASWCLTYPDEALLERRGLLRAALTEQDRSGREPAVAALGRFLDHLDATPGEALRTAYVDLFDLSYRHALHLSYWTDGDTRRRGEVLTRFKRSYRDSGFLVDLRGELPDHLPTVLEFAAVADPEAGEALLREYRPSLELLRLALEERGTPYAEVLTAVCATLPGPSPRDRAAVMAMVGGPPPAETVGLEPYDPRLLPLEEVAAGAAVETPRSTTIHQTLAGRR